MTAFFSLLSQHQHLILASSVILLILLTVLIFLLLIKVQKLSSVQLQTSQKLLEQSNVNAQIHDKFSQHQQQQQSLNHQQIINQQADLKRFIEQLQSDFRLKVLRQLGEQNEQFNHNQHKAVDQLVEHLNKATLANREELAKALALSGDKMEKRIDALTQSTDKRLQDISGQVEKRLAEGFDKTTKTFNDILKRLALIDDAQKKITELSSNVVSLQEVLADKRSRGAFGEVQLNALIRNVLPEKHFALQHTLSNGKIADCVMFLPAPTGNVVIDSKFPLESYRKMADNQLGEHDRKAAERQFKTDIKKHINDISGKYLIDRETADGAVMFIPAEAIFAEIHAHQSDLVDYANKKRVWLASPTTLMAILTTARSVLKDEATRQQIHIIQAHLSDLAVDFSRFRNRFDNLAKHIDQAASDVKQIHTSANKISNRFEKIEKVELQIGEVEALAEQATVAQK